MKKDRHPKIEIIGRHIPEFPGYRAIHHLETDRLLRHFLVGRLSEVRDQLADFIADLPDGGPRQALGESLRQLAAIKQRLARSEESVAEQISVTAEQEEALLDFDLNLLDKSAALRGALDAMDREGGGPSMQTTLAALVDELDDLLEKRKSLLQMLSSP